MRLFIYYCSLNSKNKLKITLKHLHEVCIWLESSIICFYVSFKLVEIWRLKHFVGWCFIRWFWLKILEIFFSKLICFYIVLFWKWNIWMGFSRWLFVFLRILNELLHFWSYLISNFVHLYLFFIIFFINWFGIFLILIKFLILWITMITGLFALTNFISIFG